MNAHSAAPNDNEGWRAGSPEQQRKTTIVIVFSFFALFADNKVLIGVYLRSSVDSNFSLPVFAFICGLNPSSAYQCRRPRV